LSTPRSEATIYTSYPWLLGTIQICNWQFLQ